MNIQTERTITMRVNTLLLTVTAALMLISCDGTGITNSEESTNDGNLISAIQKSTSRETIDIDQLPISAQRQLISDYASHQPVQAVLANKYGYEVFMEGQRNQFGLDEVVYFDMDGRKLAGTLGGKQERGKRFGRFNRCFEFVYPITVLLPDESTITLDSAADRSKVRDWFTANPEVEGKPALQFPVTIIYEDGTEVVLADQEEMHAERSACPKPSGRRWDKCFTLELPVSFLMPDGTIITVNSDDEFSQIKEWREANPDVEEKHLLQFPVTIIYNDGTAVEIATVEDMQAAKKDCVKDRRGGKGNRKGGGK